jgi:GNAT superfamily N-acetyltransferase
VTENPVSIIQTEKDDRYWNGTKELAKNCSWVAGPRLNELMDTYEFKNWEKVFTAVVDDRVIGFSTFTKVDCIPNSPHYPFIGFVFVSEVYRGNQIAKKMIEAIIKYAGDNGFKEVYIASTEKGLYEKMNFKLIDHQKDHWGDWEQVFIRKTESNNS